MLRNCRKHSHPHDNLLRCCTCFSWKSVSCRKISACQEKLLKRRESGRAKSKSDAQVFRIRDSMSTWPIQLLTSSSSKTHCTSSTVNWRSPKGGSSCTRSGPGSEGSYIISICSLYKISKKIADVNNALLLQIYITKKGLRVAFDRLFNLNAALADTLLWVKKIPLASVRVHSHQSFRPLDIVFHLPSIYLQLSSPYYSSNLAHLWSMSIFNLHEKSSYVYFFQSSFIPSLRTGRRKNLSFPPRKD
jgi:hypothetical protein